MTTTTSRAITTTVLVSALGYFVDIYDLLLFGIVRVTSLKSLGVPAEKLLDTGVYLLNMQMTGMLLGGILWGILGDKKGRVSVLFGSIFLYSVANIANAFVTSVPMYGWLRLLAGVGLAGELGAAITLVSEIMSNESRGWGTTIVASVGITGAIFAALIGQHFSWQVAFIIGGVLGFLLLALRIGIFESGMFAHVQERTDIAKGDLLMLFRSQKTFIRYASCILIGLPIWFVIGILITFSPELSRALGVTGGVIVAGKSIMYCYMGLSFGDFGSGFLSQIFKTRKKTVLLFLLLTLVFVCTYTLTYGLSSTAFYFLCAVLGFATGYWAMFVTIASEQFGTNLRATVTTTVPNFVRGSVVPLTLCFELLKKHFSLPHSALMVGLVCIAIALLALLGLHETFGKDLDYVELG